MVTVTKSQQLLGVALTTVWSWLAGPPQRSIKLELDGDVLELTGLSSKDQQRLAHKWLHRRTYS